MSFLKNLFKSNKTQVPEQKLQTYSNQQKMQYILQNIKTKHNKIMEQIAQQFQQKIQYQFNVCYDQYKQNIDQFGNCAQIVKSQAQSRIETYKKKIAFISIVASRCLTQQRKQVSQCRNNALQTAQSIMNSQLEFIKNWNPHI